MAAFPTLSVRVAFGSPPYPPSIVLPLSLYCVDTGNVNVTVVDVTTNAILATIAVGSAGSNLTSVVVSADQQLVAVCDWGLNQIYIIDTTTNTVTNTIALGSPDPYECAFSPDGSTLYVTDTAASSLRAYSTLTWTLTAFAGGIPLLKGVVVSPDGSTAYCSYPVAGSVGAINTSSMTQTSTVTVGSGPLNMAQSAKGSTLCVVNGTANTVSVIATSGLTVSHTISLTATADAIAFAPSGTSAAYVLSVANPAVLTVINPSAGTAGAPTTLTGYKAVSGTPGPGLAISPDGTTLYIPLERISDSHGVIATYNIGSATITGVVSISSTLIPTAIAYAAPTIWTEIGPASGLGPKGLGWVRSISTKRGRERLLASQSQFQAGTLSGSLDNRDRRFDPTNTAGPYYPNVQPGKLMQVGATWSSIFYPFWTGYVDDIPQQWPGMSESNVPISATDFFKYAAAARLLSAGYQQGVLGDGPSGYWRLGDVVGSTIALDSSGNDLNGTPNAYVTFGETGAMSANIGTSAQLAAAPLFSGDAGQIELPPTIASVATASVECWANTTSVDGPELVTSAPMTLSLTAGGLPTVTVFGASTSTRLTGTVPVNDGTWHHIVATTNATTTDLYVDGALVASAASPAGPFGSLVYWDIGNSVANVDAVNMQEVAIYDYALTSTQVLNHFELGGWPSEYTGQVVNRILDTIGFPSDQRSVDTGHTLCQKDIQDETQTKVLDQLQKLEQTEQGQCFVAADGNLTFQDRYHRFESPNANSIASLGDGGSAYPTEIPYTMGGVVLNFDWDELFNDVPVTRRNGNLQEVMNQTSIDEFNIRSMTGLSDLLMEFDVDALGCASWILSDTAFPLYRLGQLILDPTADSRLWPIVLGAEIGNVLTVYKHNIPGGGSPVPISLVVRLEGVQHEIVAPRSWKTTMNVSLMGTQTWLILNDPVMDGLDAGNRYGW